MNEYVNRKDLRDALYDADAVTMKGVKIINQFPSVDVAPIAGATHKPVGSAEFYEVICVECGARIRRSSKRKAVEAWNRRADNGNRI